MGMPLSELLDGVVDVSGGQPADVTGIATDSREVRVGDVFLALAGRTRHGLEFLPQVEHAGASAVLWEPPAPTPLAPEVCATSIPCIPVPGLSRVAGEIANRFYGAPSNSLRVIGVTGTDGKTSCAHFLAQALSKSGAPCGLIGTLGYGLPGRLTPGPHTTPDAVTVHRILANVRDAGGTAVAMEVSSHGLDQGRVNGVHFDTALLTNLTRDHLDYHGTMDEYAAAKARLFRSPGLRRVVLNLQDPFGRLLATSLPPVDRIGYSVNPDPERSTAIRLIFARNIELLPDGLAIRVAGDWGEGEFRSSLLGRFNASNLLGVLGVLLGTGIPFDEALTRLAALRTVPGRMQRFGGDGRPLVVVDYAHTPNALEQVLAALREHGRGRLVCAFGCGGDRDRGKRADMARAAERGADFAIVTDDNPRSEDANGIVRDILAGFSSSARFDVVRDRRTAITRAIDWAGPGDTVLIAGKGHEEYQLVNGQRLHFSDAETVAQLLGIRG